MKSLRADLTDAATFAVLEEAAVDVTGAVDVSVSVSADSSVLWLNVNGVCLARVCRIKQLTLPPTREVFAVPR